MVDIYSAIVGEPPTEREKLEALAAKLRNRSQIGQLGMLTGDKVLAPMGQGIAKQTEDQAGQIGQWSSNIRNREANAQLAREAREFEGIQSGLTRDFNAQQNALERAMQRELEGMKQARVTSAEAKAEAAAKKDLDRYTRMYSKEIDAAGLPELGAGIAKVDSYLKKYEGQSIPGIGFMDYKARTTQEGSEVRQAVQDVQNTLLKALSGAAVTQSEADRLEKQMFGPLATEASFKAGWQTLKEKIAAKQLNIDRGYDPAVRENYLSNMPDTPAAPAGTAAPAETGGDISFEEFKRRRAAGEL